MEKCIIDAIFRPRFRCLRFRELTRLEIDSLTSDIRSNLFFFLSVYVDKHLVLSINIHLTFSQRLEYN